MSDQNPGQADTPEIPLTPEAAAAGQDPQAVSDPSREAVKEGTVDAPTE